VKVILTSVKRYDFIDEKTGKQVKGCNVVFLEPSSSLDSDFVGLRSSKQSLPYEHFQVYSTWQFPQLADAQIDQIITARGIQSKITSFKPVKYISFDSDIKESAGR
jgi:hypothetical protein